MTILRLMLVVLFAALALPAHAQFASTGGGDIMLDADDVVSANGVTTLTGQVDIRQVDTRILADTVVIYSRTAGAGATPTLGAAGGDIDRMVATGNFYYITPDQNVRGNQGVYTAASDSFEVTGDVLLTQEDSVVSGQRLIYELGTQKARVISDCKGRKCGPRNRVSILIKNSGSTDSGARS